jgi:hypothetical protein
MAKYSDSLSLTLMELNNELLKLKIYHKIYEGNCEDQIYWQTNSVIEKLKNLSLYILYDFREDDAFVTTIRGKTSKDRIKEKKTGIPRRLKAGRRVYIHKGSLNTAKHKLKEKDSDTASQKEEFSIIKP